MLFLQLRGIKKEIFASQKLSCFETVASPPLKLSPTVPAEQIPRSGEKTIAGRTVAKRTTLFFSHSNRGFLSGGGEAT